MIPATLCAFFSLLIILFGILGYARKVSDRAESRQLERMRPPSSGSRINEFFARMEAVQERRDVIQVGLMWAAGLLGLGAAAFWLRGRFALAISLSLPLVLAPVVWEPLVSLLAPSPEFDPSIVVPPTPPGADVLPTGPPGDDAIDPIEP